MVLQSVVFMYVWGMIGLCIHPLINSCTRYNYCKVYTSIILIVVFCVFVHVCVSIILTSREREVVAPCCLHQCGELRLASYNDFFLSWHNTWFKRKSLWNFFTANSWNHALYITMMQYLRLWPSSCKVLSFFAFNWDAEGKKTSSLPGNVC